MDAGAEKLSQHWPDAAGLRRATHSRRASTPASRALRIADPKVEHSGEIPPTFGL